MILSKGLMFREETRLCSGGSPTINRNNREINKLSHKNYFVLFHVM